MTNAVTIIGAGVIGLSCAWRLSAQGYKVTVYHGCPIGIGASGNAAGALAPFNADQTGWKQTLQQQSLWVYPTFIKQLEEASGQKLTFWRCGRLAIYAKAAALRKVQKSVLLANAQWPFTAPVQEVISMQQAQHLVPFASQLEGVGAIKCQATAVFSPCEVLQALFTACKKNGVVFIHETLSTLPPQRPLLVTAGAHSATLLPELGLKPIKKQAILLHWPYDTPLNTLVENTHIYCVPWLKGKAVYIGATTEAEAGFCQTPTLEAAQWLRQQAQALFPKLAKTPLLQHFVGLQHKCYGTKELAVTSTLFMGEIPEREGVFAAVGHGGVGFCMAPASASFMATKLAEFYAA